jgi:hypothetical protein
MDDDWKKRPLLDMSRRDWVWAAVFNVIISLGAVAFSWFN